MHARISLTKLTCFLTGHFPDPQLQRGVTCYFVLYYGYRLQEEVDMVLGGKHKVTYDDIGRLDYMSMVLKETLRLYPPAPFTFRTNPKDITINKYKIPKDTIFLVSDFNVHIRLLRSFVYKLWNFVFANSVLLKML